MSDGLFLPKRVAKSALEHLYYDTHRLALPVAFEKYFQTRWSDDEYDQTKSKNWAILLYPDKPIRDLFGITKDVLCVVSEYEQFYPPTLDYADRLLRRFGHRSTDDAFILVSCSDAFSYCNDYLNRTGRTVIQCTWDEVIAANPEFPINLFQKYLFSRDLFNQKSPVRSDFQFFARNKTVDEIFDDLRTGQNRGIFGLRKTGKTSVLQRVLDKNGIKGEFLAVLMDAQSPTLSEGTAASVALEIARQFRAAFARVSKHQADVDIPSSGGLQEAAMALENTMRFIASKNRRSLLVIDELERILPSTTRVTSWHQEYLRLWRLLRSISQSLLGGFVFLLASTNPFFVEESAFEGEDNPLYAFVKDTFLGLFSLDELSYMISTLGRRMGVAFDGESLQMLYREYGGHPFLSRQLCSFAIQSRTERPLRINRVMMEEDLRRFFERIVTDLDAILKVFKDYYPDEHAALELLAKSPKEMAQLLDDDPLLAKHLKGYGLVRSGANGRLEFALNALTYYYMRPRPSVPKAPQLSEKASERFRVLDKRMTEIEVLLRSIVYSNFITAFRAKWRDEVLKSSSPETRERVKAAAPDTPPRFMEELELRDLFQAVARKFSLFQSVFYNRDDFLKKAEDSVEGRRIVAHKKLVQLQDDTTFFRVDGSTQWMLNCLRG